MRFSFIVFGAACLVDLSNASTLVIPGQGVANKPGSKPDTAPRRKSVEAVVPHTDALPVKASRVRRRSATPLVVKKGASRSPTSTAGFRSLDSKWPSLEEEDDEDTEDDSASFEDADGLDTAPHALPRIQRQSSGHASPLGLDGFARVAHHADGDVGLDIEPDLFGGPQGQASAADSLHEPFSVPAAQEVVVPPPSRAVSKMNAKGKNRWGWVQTYDTDCVEAVSLARASKRGVTLCPAPSPSTFESLVVYEPSKCLMAFSFDIRDGKAAKSKLPFAASTYGMGCPDGRGASPHILSQLGEITAVEGNKLSSGIAQSLEGEAIPTTGGTFECRDKYNRVIGAFWMPDVKAGMDVGWTHFAGRDGIQVGKVKVSRDRVRNYCASLFLRGQQIYQTLTETATRVPGNSKEAPRTPLYAPYLGRPVDDGCFHGILQKENLAFALCDHTLEIKHGECSLTYPNLRWFSQHSDLKDLAKDADKQKLVMEPIMDAVSSDEFGSVCIDARGEKAIRQSIKKSVGTATLSDNEDDKNMVNVGCTESNVNARDGGAVASTYTVPKMDKLHSPLTYYNGFRSAFTRDKTLARKFCALVLERRHVISTALDMAFPHGDYEVVRTEA